MYGSRETTVERSGQSQQRMKILTTVTANDIYVYIYIYIVCSEFFPSFRVSQLYFIRITLVNTVIRI